MSEVTPDRTVQQPKKLWIIYDERANPINGTDDALVLCTARSLKEARRDVQTMFPRGVIWEYDVQNEELVNETFVEGPMCADELAACLRAAPPSVCPHCQLPAVLPEVCTPEINAAIEDSLAQDWDFYHAAREAGKGWHAEEARRAAPDAAPRDVSQEQDQQRTWLKIRTWEAMQDRAKTGETPESLAADYDVPVAFVRFVLLPENDLARYARG